MSAIRADDREITLLLDRLMVPVGQTRSQLLVKNRSYCIEPEQWVNLESEATIEPLSGTMSRVTLATQSFWQ